QQVDIPLDEEDPAGLPNGSLGEVEAVEELPLVEALGLGRVDVLGEVVAEGPAAEADQSPGGVADREDQAVPEAVVGLAAPLRARRQPDRQQVAEGDLAGERLDQVAPPLGGVAEAELLGERGR